MDLIKLREYSDSMYRALDDISSECDRQVQDIRQKHANKLKEKLSQRKHDWNQTFGRLLDEFVGEQKRERVPMIQSFPPAPANQVPVAVSLAPSTNGLTSTAVVAPKPVVSEIPSPKQIISPESSEPIEEIIEDCADQQQECSQAIEAYALKLSAIDSTKEKLKPFVSDTNLTKYRNDLQLFVRTQINTISTGSRDMLADKVHRFTCLFSGRPVKYQDRLIDTQKHESATLFCLDLAASAFITVATKQVNSVPEAANSMATVISLLAEKFPLFGVLVIGYIQQRCPYTVPMYPKQEGMSEVEHKIACGYNYSSKNVLETEDNYLLRMRALCLLYAAILRLSVIQEAWTWLASLLNQKPEPVITATVLQALLQELSPKLLSKYGKQHMKLLNFIDKVYLKMINTASKDSNRQSLVKLQIFMEEEKKTTSHFTPACSSGRNIFASPFGGHSSSPLRL